MIESFKHKGLQELFEKNATARLPQDRLRKIKLLLAALDAAQASRDLEIPAFRLHKLKKPPLTGYYSIDVTGNYRLVFWFENGKVTKLDF